jgi:hypothetical protein
MPIGAYFKGEGNKVMRAMRKTYSDPKKAKSVFYATANARGMTADADPGETRTYTITAPAEVLERFERFLALVQWCAGVGHSTTCGFSIDGDGADRFEVEENLPEFEEDDVITRGSPSGEGSYEMVRANDCMDHRARMHSALDRVMDRKRRMKDDFEGEGGFEHSEHRSRPLQPYDDVRSKDAPAEMYDPAQSKTGRAAIRARLHATLDRCIDAVRGRKAGDAKSECARCGKETSRMISTPQGRVCETCAVKMGVKRDPRERDTR